MTKIQKKREKMQKFVLKEGKMPLRLTTTLALYVSQVTNTNKYKNLRVIIEQRLV